LQALVQNPKSPLQNWLLWGALAVLALALALKVAQSAGIMAGLFAWPYQLDESEGMIVAETLLLDSGKNIYDPVTPQLFVAAPYPPLFYLLNWPVLHFVGVSFKVGRALSLLATLGAAAAIFAIVRRVTGDGVAGGLAAGVWASLGVVASGARWSSPMCWRWPEGWGGYGGCWRGPRRRSGGRCPSFGGPFTASRRPWRRRARPASGCC
jgi:hypothetical protein